MSTLGKPRTYDWERIVALSRRGRTHQSIANEVGCTKAHVGHVLRARGIHGRALKSGRMAIQAGGTGGGRPRTIDADLARRLAESGQHPKEIASRLRCSLSHVYALSHREGFALPSMPRAEVPTPPRVLKSTKIHQLALKGMSPEAAAKRAGATRQWAGVIYRSLGLSNGRHGGVPGQPRKPKRIDMRQAMKMLHDGAMPAAVADRLGCSQKQIEKIAALTRRSA